MAKGFAAYIIEEHRKVEEALLLDVYLKYQGDDYLGYEEEENLFEYINFKE